MLGREPEETLEAHSSARLRSVSVGEKVGPWLLYLAMAIHSWRNAGEITRRAYERVSIK
jgi:hypothetical protein